MRTTVTIDADTEALLKTEVTRTGQSFKVVLNQAVKKALGKQLGKFDVKPLFSKPFPPALDQANFNHLANEWDDEDTLQELST